MDNGNQGGQQFRITDRQQEVLDAISNGTTSTSDLAKQFDVTYSAISSMIKRLEDHGLVSRAEDGSFMATGNQGGQQGNQGGANQGGQQGNQGGDTKINGARQIFQQSQNEPRKSVLEKFMTQLGMTLAGASTYYQKLRGEFGMANQQHAMANNQRGGRAGGNQGGGRGGNQGGNQGRGSANQGGNRGRVQADQGAVQRSLRGGGNQGGNQGRGAANQGGNRNRPGQPGNTAGKGNRGGSRTR